MAEVQHLKDKGIPLRIDGSTRYVRGATKYTTCGDVIKMVLKKTGIGKEYRHLFAIYEVSLQEEKLIPCKSRILKVIESWAGATYKLVLRKTEPIDSVPNIELPDSKKSKVKNAKPKTQPGQTQDAYMKTLVSLAKFVEKQKSKLEANQSEDTANTSTDSDSSIDDFLSSLDKSKMAGFVHFFAAMAGGKKKKACVQPRIRQHTSDSDDSSEVSPKYRGRHRKGRQQTRMSRRPRKTAVGDVHPNKMHKVERINFGFIDVEPTSRDQVYPEVRKDETKIDNTYMIDPLSRHHPARQRTARRRLLPKRLSYNMDSVNSSCSGFLKDTSSITSEEDYLMTGTFKPIRSMTNVCCGRDESCRQNSCYLGDHNDTVSSEFASPLVVNKAFVGTNNIVSTRALNDVTYVIPKSCSNTSSCLKHNAFIPEPVREQKLVDYPITDDESEESDADSARSKCSYSSITSSVSGDTRLSKQDSHYTGSDDVCANHVTDNLDISDYIRSVFSKGCSLSEDEAMNSFMKSMTSDGDSADEGLCSMESDLEKEMKI